MTDGTFISSLASGELGGEENDFVVVEYHIVGEQRGPIGRIPAQKDNLLKMFDVDVVQLKDHKITHIWRYDNPAQLLVEAKP